MHNDYQLSDFDILNEYSLPHSSHLVVFVQEWIVGLATIRLKVILVFEKKPMCNL